MCKSLLTGVDYFDSLVSSVRTIEDSVFFRGYCRGSGAKKSSNDDVMGGTTAKRERK
jgi:hypothetical protein